MIGNARWNYTIALAGMGITFIVSISRNELLTSLFRSFFCFVAVFLLAYLFRWIFGTVLGFNQTTHESAAGEQLHDQPQSAGQHVDLSTPEELDFVPLELPKVEVDIKQTDPAQLVGALRHLSDHEG